MLFERGLDHVEQEFAVQVKEENGKQRGVDAERHEKSFQNFCFHIVSSFNYQVMESSNSSSVGSRGSSCITVVM